MVRRYLLALVMSGLALAVAASSSQAGWGYHSGSSERGETMSSESSTPAPEESTGAYDNPGERSKETSGYQAEQPVETGKLPETGNSESGEHVVYESGGQLFRQGIDDGP